MHKYMNKELNLCAVIMHSTPGYKAGKKVWCTDFTYMRQPNGKFRYNCSKIDLYECTIIMSVMKTAVLVIY